MSSRVLELAPRLVAEEPQAEDEAGERRDERDRADGTVVLDGTKRISATPMRARRRSG
jgi:hypothetical protein